MKIFLLAILALTSFKTFADNRFDNLVTVCQNGAYKLRVEGKQSFLGSRKIQVIKDNQVIIEEGYREVLIPYAEHTGMSASSLPEYRDIINYAYKLKPQSIHSEMDFTFRVSDNAILLQTYSPLQPKFGGDTPALIVQLLSYKKFVIFELNTNCKLIRN